MDAKWMDFCPSCHGREDDHFYLCWRDGSFFFFLNKVNPLKDW